MQHINIKLFLHHCSHLIQGKANGVHVLTLAPVSAAVLLHEGYQKTARHLVIIWVIIFLHQRDFILRVDPKCVYTNSAYMLSQLSKILDKTLAHYYLVI